MLSSTIQDRWVSYNTVPNTPVQITNISSAERSKALASGASREICVGSNPTLFTLFLYWHLFGLVVESDGGVEDQRPSAQLLFCVGEW